MPAHAGQLRDWVNTSSKGLQHDRLVVTSMTFDPLNDSCAPFNDGVHRSTEQGWQFQAKSAWRVPVHRLVSPSLTPTVLVGVYSKYRLCLRFPRSFPAYHLENKTKYVHSCTHMNRRGTCGLHRHMTSTIKRQAYKLYTVQQDRLKWLHLSQETRHDPVQCNQLHISDTVATCLRLPDQAPRQRIEARGQYCRIRL